MKSTTQTKQHNANKITQRKRKSITQAKNTTQIKKHNAKKALCK